MIEGSWTDTLVPEADEGSAENAESARQPDRRTDKSFLNFIPISSLYKSVYIIIMAFVKNVNEKAVQKSVLNVTDSVKYTKSDSFIDLSANNAGILSKVPIFRETIGNREKL